MCVIIMVTTVSQNRSFTFIFTLCKTICMHHGVDIFPNLTKLSPFFAVAALVLIRNSSEFFIFFATDTFFLTLPVQQWAYSKHHKLL